MSGKFKAHGIVLRRTKLAECDLIVTLLADCAGQLRVVAKGARKPSAKLAGAMNLGNEVELLVSEGRGLPIVSEARLVRSHANVAADYDRAVLVDAALDCACELTVEGNHDSPLLAAAFIFKAAAMQGFRPCLDTCVRCGAPVELAQAGRVAFDISEGGVVCPECACAAAIKTMDASTLSWTRALISLRLADICACEFPSDETCLSAGFDQLHFAQTWLGHYPGIRPRALDFALTTGLY